MAVPRIAITAGEPAGIGPDITLASAFQDWSAELVVYADRQLLEERAALLGLEPTFIDFDPTVPAKSHEAGQLLIHNVPQAQPSHPGELDPANAPYVLETLRRACADCLDGTCQAMVTAPVQKSVINEAGVAFSGHTEFLAEETHTPRVVMMLATESLRVALATTHLPLKDVSAAITPESLRETLQILHADLKKKFGLQDPRVTVLGLNPHAGENGHIGHEEIDTIIPVLEELRGTGMQISGPLPADTAFTPAVLSDCDAVLAMYHDQGLPVLKFSGFGRAVNITLGLPIIRTSVDHGTALELAGSGKASTGSMEQAIHIACQMLESGAKL